MSKNFMKKTLAGIFALVIVASSTPAAPFVTVMDSNSITASASEVTADGLAYEVNEDRESITITGYSGTSSDVVIPSKIADVPVTVIGDEAFSGNRTIINVTIPDTVTSIGEYAFFESYLEKINIPGSVTSIGIHAFAGTYITDLVIPASIKSISKYAFSRCGWLTNVTLPASVTSIGDSAFGSCSALKNVKYTGSLTDWCSISIERGNEPLTNAKITLSQGEQIICGSTLIWTLDDNGVMTISGDDETFPEFRTNNTAVEWCDKRENVKKVVFKTSNLTTLGSGAFYKFANLESIVFPESLTTINEMAFYTCPALKDITLPDSLTTISDLIFYDCTSLKTINIPDTVTSIGEYAFSHCPLTEVIIPDSLTTISNYAFSDTALTEVTIPNSVKSLGFSVFMNCTSLKKVTIPGSIEIISSCTFQNCSSLESITIPDSVKELWYAAFMNCTSLSDVTIPDSVTLIDESAFYNCENLTSITIPDTVTSIGQDAFCGCNKLTSITAPCALKDSMKKAMGNCTAEITYTHKYSKNGYVITCTDCGVESVDYTDVFAALDDYDGSNESNYTADSWEDYSDAAAAIKTLTDNFGKDVFVSEQAELNDAVTAYNDAKIALVRATDYTELNAAISEVADYEKQEYTAASWAILEKAFSEANALADDQTASQDDVDLATANLLEAIDSLKYLANTTALENVLNAAADEDEYDYAADVWAQIQALILEADAYIGKDLAAEDYQTDIDSLTEEINGLLEKKLHPADYTLVDDALCAIPDDESSYTDESWATLQAAVDSVIRDLKEDKQGEVNAMALAINNAIAELVLKDADYTLVEQYLAQADAVDRVLYTDDSLADLNIATGAVVRGLDITHQDEVQWMADAINDAIKALVLKDADYTMLDAAITDANGYTADKYTEDSWAVLKSALAEATAVARDLKADQQDTIDVAIYNLQSAISNLEEKPQYETLYENYLVKAPTVNETGTYNKRAYHYEGDTKIVDNEAVFDTAKEVSFAQWYLRTMIQYKVNGSEFDLRFVSMLDENLDQYQKAGFIFTINGTAVSDELSTVTANTSYIVDEKEVKINAFSEDDDYFFLQNYVFDSSKIDLDATLAVTAYVVLADGTELQGEKAVTFTLRQFEG